MRFKYDNTANVKLASELSRYHANRKPSKPWKPSKATFKNLIRSTSAFWIRDESEPIIGLLKGNYPSRDKDTLLLALEKGWVTTRDGGLYDNYHFTSSGLKIKNEVAATTCAFSGRRCKAMR